MNFLAVLDYEHLDNGMFLTAFAKSLAKKNKRGIILHGESEYTERIIQTGVIRSEANTRAIKDLNHRLIALLADEGISAIGLNGFQKSTIKTDGDHIYINHVFLSSLPEPSMVLVSNLVENMNGSKPIKVSLPLIAAQLQKDLKIPEITIFTKDDSSDIIKTDLPVRVTPLSENQSFLDKHIPKNFHSFSGQVFLTTPSLF